MITIDSNIYDLLLPNIITVLTQLCATAFLCFIMYKLAYKPVKNILDTRSAFEQEKLAQASKTQQEADEIKAELKAQLDCADEKANEIINNATLEGQKIKENLIKEGKEKGRAIVIEASEEAEMKKKKMLDEMHQQIVDVALNVTEKMLSSKVYDKADEDLIDNFIKEVNEK